MANWPIALLIIVAIVGVPLWLTVRHQPTRAETGERHHG
jgi:hypothetical protein